MATKTSFATWLLYSVFRSGVLGGAGETANTRALIFNVKGEDLLFLDHPNTRLDADTRSRVRPARAGRRPVPRRVRLRAAAGRRPYRRTRRGQPAHRGRHASTGRVAEFCADRLLPYVFADADDDRQQYTMVVHAVAAYLHRHAEPADGGVVIDGVRVNSYPDLVDLIEERLSDDDTRGEWAGSAVGLGTVNAFLRRLISSIRDLSRLIRGDLPTDRRHGVNTAESAQVTVVDLHNLPDRAQRFVVGVILKTEFERKEKAGTAKPLLFVVLDELNKYAPREGSSPIKEVLLDIAERGRSLGVVLIGAQQTASEVERRILVNSAIKVVGRLDAAEASRPEYGFLPPAQQQAGPDRQAGHHVHQPARHPGAAGGRVPVPGLGHPPVRGRRRRRAPRCARWCSPPTRSRWSAPPGRAWRRPGHRSSPTTRSRSEGARMKILHTSDWHVGKVLKGQSRLDEQLAVLKEIVDIAEAERPDLVIVAGDLYDTAAPTAETEKIVVRALSALRRHAAAVVVDRRQPRPRRRAWTRCARGPTRPASRCAARSARPRSTCITGVTAGGEAWRLAALPFVSQRYAVRASEMFELSAAEASATYADHVARLVAALTDGLRRRHRDGQPGHRPPDRGRRQARRRRARRAHHRGLRGAVDASSRRPPTTSRWATCTAASRCPGRARCTTAARPLAVDFGEEENAPSVSIVELSARQGGQGPRGAGHLGRAAADRCGARWPSWPR